MSRHGGRAWAHACVRAYAQRARADLSSPRIELIADGFDIVDADGERHAVRWAQVTSVATYKLDHVATDEIIVAFELVDRPGTTLLASEEWVGFSALRAAMEQRLDISPGWVADVMKPAFATNFRVLYERRDAATLGDRGQATG